jgi:hypothetical protein
MNDLIVADLRGSIQHIGPISDQFDPPIFVVQGKRTHFQPPVSSLALQSLSSVLGSQATQEAINRAFASYGAGETGSAQIEVQDTALSQEQLNVPQAEAEHAGVADDLGWESMAVLWVGWRLHAASLARLRARGQTWLP